MGCSNGYETIILANKFSIVDVIDGSSEFIRKLNENNGSENLNFMCSLFEEYSLVDGQNKYDYIFCNYVLEHVFDPVVVLRNIRKSLKDDGIIFAVVPNATAFSRQLAKKMKILDNLKALTENDKTHGHRRVYDIADIKNDFISSGFEIIDIRGIIFKILADFQLNKMLEQNIIEKNHIIALQEMADGMMEFCDSILVVARKIKD
jgi:2-polyprenyl-3-methyl-5-hydroxy-6-metoxy-1,4-benzoquinol methylase